MSTSKHSLLNYLILFIILIDFSTFDRPRQDKFSSFNNSNAEPEKYSKFEFLHQRINDVDERLSEVTDQTNKKFTVVKENVKLSFKTFYR